MILLAIGGAVAIGIALFSMRKGGGMTEAERIAAGAAATAAYKARNPISAELVERTRKRLVEGGMLSPTASASRVDDVARQVEYFRTGRTGGHGGGPANDVFSRTVVQRVAAIAASTRSYAKLWSNLATPLLGKQAPDCPMGPQQGAFRFRLTPRFQDDSVQVEWTRLRDDVSRSGTTGPAAEESVSVNPTVAPAELWTRYDRLKRRADAATVICA